MKFSLLSASMVAGLLMSGAFAHAQSSGNTNSSAPATTKQKTDGASPTIVGPGSGAYKQNTDGASPTIVGPGSGAYKQKTDGASPTIVGPGSGAYKH